MNGKKTLRAVLSRLSEHRPLIILSLLMSVATVILTLYLPVLFGRAIDLIVEPPGLTDRSALGAVLLRAAVVAASAAAFQWTMSVINNRIAFETVEKVRGEAIRKISRLPLSYIDSHPSGDIVSRVITDADQFSDGLLLGFTQLFSGVVTVLCTVVFMVKTQPLIAVLVIVLTPASLLMAKFIAGRTYDFFSDQSKVRGEQTAFIDEMIQNQKTVKAFSREDENVEKFREINDRLFGVSLKATFFSSLTNPSTRFINAIIYALVALFGAFFAFGGSLTVGGLTCLLSYANQYTKPFNEISGVITELQNALACAGRLFELIDEAPSLPAEPEEDCMCKKGEVKLEKVCFSYRPEQRLIENLDLTAKAGEKIAIVGPTGCGKTTLINLLMRFYDVGSGSVSIDGVDINSVSAGAVRRSYGMVLQDTWIKNATVRENIAFGRPDATDDEIIEAAKSAHAYGFIRKMPEGLDTVISDEGGSLSQGQRQLLCIARVMLCQPPMLILDEATSSIDTRTEMKIQDAFSKLMRGRTSFIVAHRLSTVRDADLIIVMRDGSVVEQGTHASLLKKKGQYYALYNSQFAR